MLKFRAKIRFYFEYIPTVEVTSILKQLKSKKATGQDGFPPRVIKDGADCLIQPLFYIVNQSLFTRIFPDKPIPTDRYLFCFSWLKLQKEQCEKVFYHLTKQNLLTNAKLWIS